ncbi:nuclear protein 96-domain-containing protein [Lipomyces arxii]|uniref:nuclear protein 96-domain-containing protein n=1 Tax=Lipomyces arxii TaxID=56418 RepID=UPI0034CEF660
MFGQSSGTGSAFGGFGANNNNNNNDNSNTLFGNTATSSTPAFGANTATTNSSPFGQSSGFGTNNVNTGTGLFGQNSNQSSGFGGFGSTARPSFGAANTGFGANTNSGGLFGSTANTAQNTTSPFGGASTGFGAATTAISPFGQTNNASTGTGLFGANAAKPAFGGFGATSSPASSTATGFGGGFAASIGSTNQGTAAVPFAPVKEKEASSNVTNNFQSITYMPAYLKYSFEELREQDYAQGRRFGNGNNSGAGAFGKSTGFGTGTFGQTNNSPSAFGQPATTTGGSSLFGASTNQSSGFGTNNNAFGSNTNTSGGLFGQKPATGGLFGASTTTPTTGSGLFGSNTNTSTGFGASNTTAFGQTNSNNAFGGTSTFGQNNATQNKPAFGAPASGGFGGFGATNSTAASQPSTFGGFGSTTTSTPAFGATNNTNTSGGLFGSSTNNTVAPAFGQPAATATSTFGGFGATANNSNQAKPAFGAGFGAPVATNTTPSLFGTQQNQAKPPAFGAGFGQTPARPATGGLFGNTAASAPQAGAPLFGNNSTAAPGGTSLFGNVGASQPNTGGGLFGSKPQTNMFGNSQAQPTTSLFGSNNTATGGFGAPAVTNNFGAAPTMSNSLFGNSQNGNSNQGNFLQASIDQNPFGSDPLFNAPAQNVSSLGPIATPLSSASVQKKKPAMLPSYKLSPRPPSTPHSRGAATRIPSGSYGNASNGSVSSMSSGRSILFDGVADRAILSSEAFSPRSDIRKLVIDRKFTETDLLSGGVSGVKFVEAASKTGEKPSVNGVEPKAKVMTEVSSSEPKLPTLFNSIKSVPSVPAMKEASLSPRAPSPQPASPATVTSTNTAAVASTVTANQADANDGYWCSPSASVLSKMNIKDLEHVPDFKVGRKGYGEVTFNQPVDLSGLAHPEQIPGQLVLFGHKTCTVYPDDSIKPEIGKGLNVPATITLENCFPLSKDRKQPITEVDHPMVPIHIERLRRIKGTHFVTYIADTGSWVFTVAHFSIWGLLDDEDEYETGEFPAEVPPTQHVQTAPAVFIPAFQFAQPAQDSFAMDYSPMKVDSATPVKPSHVSLIDRQYISPTDMEYRAHLPGDWDAQYALENTPLAPKSFLGQGGIFRSRDAKPTFNMDMPTESSANSGQQYGEENEMISYEDREISDIKQEGTPELQSMEQDEESMNSVDEDEYVFEELAKVIEPINVPVCQDWLEQMKFTKTSNSLWAIASREKAALMDLQPAVTKKSDSKFNFVDFDNEIFGGNSFFGGSSLEVRDKKSEPRHRVAPIFSPSGDLLLVSDNDLITKKFASSVHGLQVGSDFLQSYLKICDAALRENGLPLFSPSRTMKFDDILSFYSQSATSSHIDVWKLASILFDEVEINAETLHPEGDVEIASQLLRKSRLSRFFELLVEKDVERDLISQEDKVFTFLSGHQIEAACIEAVKQKNLHVATLLPLIGGDADFRKDIKSQLEDWTEKKVLSEIPQSIHRIYELLSGNTSIAKGPPERFNEDSVPDICVSAGLDWKRAFGLRLWYESFEEDTLDKAVKSYTSAFESIADVQSPVPGHIADSSSTCRDILYELLRIYSDPEYSIVSALMPTNVSPQPLDCSVSWLLYNVLAHGKKLRSPNVAADQFSIDYAWQLESLGRWTEGVFVLLHISVLSTCQKAVQEMLNKHAPDMLNDPKAETYLLEALRVPKSMILIAKALYARYSHESIEEVKYLLEASRCV